MDLDFYLGPEKAWVLSFFTRLGKIYEVGLDEILIFQKGGTAPLRSTFKRCAIAGGHITNK